MDHLSRGQVPPSSQAPQLSYDPYVTGDDLAEQVQRVPPPPLPPKPNRTASPRNSPPKVNATHRPQPRMVDSPVNNGGVLAASQAAMASMRKEGGAPLLSRGSFKMKGVTRPKNQSSPRFVHKLDLYPFTCSMSYIYSPQAQSIIFDVSQALDEVQAPRDAVKSTAIALVRQESVFLPGTTIGATHWVAYAMTRGLCCVLCRYRVQLSERFSL